MNIVLASREFPPEKVGGQGTFVQLIANELARIGHKIDLVIPAQDQNPRVHPNITVHHVSVNGSSFLTRIPSFYKESKELVKTLSTDSDILYSHGSIITSQHQLPIVTHFHTSRLAQFFTCVRMFRPIHAAMNLLYVATDWWMTLQSNAIIIQPSTDKKYVTPPLVKYKETYHVANGIDFNLFNQKHSQPNKLRTRKRRNAQNAINIVYFGRLDANKGLTTLIDGLSMAHKLELTLTIIGSGPERKRIVKYARKIGVNLDLFDEMPRDILFENMTDFDLAIFPSHYETFGIAALECIAVGIPVITSDAYHDFGQKTFAAGDASDLASAIEDFRFNQDEYHSRASALRTQAESSFSINKIASEISAILSHTVNAKRVQCDEDQCALPDDDC